MERKRSVRRHKKYGRPFAKKCKDYCRAFIAFLFSNVGIIGLVLGYTIAGAFIFRTIEGSYHYQMRTDVINTRLEYAKIIWNFTVDLNPFLEEEYRDMLGKELKNFQKKVVHFVRKGYDGSRLEYSAQWSIAGSFLYSLTVITTIGYGNIFPHTGAGQITTIVYAIIGMPLFLLYLSNIGDVLARSFKWIYANVCLCRCCPGVAKKREERQQFKIRRQSCIEEGSSEHSLEGNRENNHRSNTPSEASEEMTESTEESDDVQSITVPVTVCLMIMVGYICGGGLLFCKWEEWEFLDASYFCFISLSTIGFGDFVPGEKIIGHKNSDSLVTDVFELSFIFCSMYLMLGMALIAMCFNLMQEEVVNKIRATMRAIKYFCGCDR